MRVSCSHVLTLAIMHVAVFVDATTSFAQTRCEQPNLKSRLDSLVVWAINQKILVGAQVAVGTSRGEPEVRSFGVTDPGADRKVDDQTLFCIGSCSKPFASACILTLIDTGQLKLNQPVSEWVPELQMLSLKGGQPAARGPTMQELLAHRGGIYSQKAGPMTPEQIRAIRDFRLTLADSVAIIGRQPLASSPGERFAYSGAGYCVAGYAAELASGMTFEALLHERIGEPLGLTRTTYFPQPDDANVAAAGKKVDGGEIVTDPNSPHLLKENLKFPLIGGSLHSTARETASFARMILNQGCHKRTKVLSRKTWALLTSQPYCDQDYGLGWSLTIQNCRTTALRHTGALYGHRSLLHINLSDDHYSVVHWTLTNPSDPRSNKFRESLVELVR